jgi:hypothetical protein
VALAEDHGRIESEKWRPIALNAFSLFAGAAGFLLLVLAPPQLDFRPITLLSVAFVAVFLAVTQRPVQTAGRSYAPLTAVIAASAVLVGYWAILLILVSFGAVRLRMGPPRVAVRELFSATSFGQAGVGVGAAYAMIAAWSGVQSIEHLAPAWADSVVAFGGILIVGVIWQVAQHGFAQIAYALLGKPSYSLQFLRVGVLASLYGYLLVAMYSYGGLLAASLFYLLVAQTRVVEEIIGLTRAMSQLEHARGQAASIVRELVHFTDVPGVQFTGEVENIAQMIARHTGLQRREIADIGLAAELHEIGKCRLPARLRYGRALNAAEEAQRRTYSRLGALMLRNADALVDPRIADYVEFHTEHFDGTGYPKGLAGEAIPFASRVIAVARGYVCLLTGYDGASKTQKEEALRRLRQDSGTLYDPRLVDLLTELVN